VIRKVLECPLLTVIEYKWENLEFYEVVDADGFAYSPLGFGVEPAWTKREDCVITAYRTSEEDDDELASADNS
jgi:hypothetical protein